MATKTTGAEFKRFYADSKYWPDGGDVWHEDEEVIVNGKKIEEYSLNVEKMADDDIITLSHGVVFGVGKGDDISFETYFKRWRKEQSTTNLVVECGINARESLAAVIKANGGKVL